MEHAYEKLMKEHNLSFTELPNDAKIGIEAIQQILKAINLAEKTGKKIKPQIYDKIKANDKWVVREILDYVESKETNTPAPPHKPEEVIKTDIVEPAAPAAPPAEPKKEEPPAAAEPKPAEPKKEESPEKVAKVDEELKALHEAGKTKLTLIELKSGAKTAYDIIFDNYTVDGENGLETSLYDLTETEKEVFTLTKK